MSNLLQGLNILVVDDDEGTREMLHVVLGAEGATVREVASSAEAFEQLDVQRPDVMVVDVSMPVVDGFTLVQQLRQRPAVTGGEVPVVALTGYLSAEDRGHADKVGFNAYVTKPADPTGLIHVLRSVSKR